MKTRKEEKKSHHELAPPEPPRLVCYYYTLMAVWGGPWLIIMSIRSYIRIVYNIRATPLINRSLKKKKMRKKKKIERRRASPKKQQQLLLLLLLPEDNYHRVSASWVGFFLLLSMQPKEKSRGTSLFLFFSQHLNREMRRVYIILYIYTLRLSARWNYYDISSFCGGAVVIA